MLNRKRGATATDQGAHVSGDSRSCSCGEPHTAFTPPDVQRRPAKHKEIFLPMHVTLEAFQGESGSCNNAKFRDTISNTSCTCGTMLCINQCTFPCIFSSKIQQPGAKGTNTPYSTPERMEESLHPNEQHVLFSNPSRGAHPRIWSRVTLQISDNLNYIQQVAVMDCSIYCLDGLF